MSYRNLMRAHEARMWLKDIIIPAATVIATIVATNPDLQDKAKSKFDDILKAFRK